MLSKYHCAMLSDEFLSLEKKPSKIASWHKSSAIISIAEAFILELTVLCGRTVINIFPLVLLAHGVVPSNECKWS